MRREYSFFNVDIADLGGVSISFAAFQRFQEKHPEALQKHNRFSQNQQFFISYGTVWRNLAKEETVKQRLLIDPHSPGEFRADGPLSNLTEFHNEFGVKEGDRMFASVEDRVTIW